MASPYDPLTLRLPKAPSPLPDSPEAWQAFFARLGMVNTLEGQGPYVEGVTRRLCHQKAKDDLRRFQGQPQETNVQVWLGEHGLVGVLSSFRSAGSPQWMLSSAA